MPKKKVKHIQRAKAHIRYKQLDGTKVPGITTITGKMTPANALAYWANNLGLNGYDSGVYAGELAAIGINTHYLAECNLQETEPDLSDYTKNQINQAQKIFENKFLKWKAKHKITVVAMEQPLVSELHPFGGTGDLFCLLDDGPLTYVDFKATESCYENHKVQCVANAKLWEEKVGDKVEDIRILRMGHDMGEDFDEIHIGLWEQRWKLFLLYLDAYHLEKQIGKGSG